MGKVNIANYVIYDLTNRFNFLDHNTMDREVIDLVAYSWHKKHYVSGEKNIRFKHNDKIHKKIII